MKLEVIISNDAENDLDETFLWYESQNTGLGERLIHFVDEGFQFISAYPEGSQEILRGLRMHIIEKFPFGIYYHIDSKKNC
jgi:plasmid stabilization system protein ParE